MSRTFEDFTKEMRPYHNHICMIYDFELVRLLGVAENDRDMYYIIKKAGFSQKEYWGSAVGRCITMAGIYPYYDVMENLFCLNGCPPTKEFRVEKYDA
tara:strand:- start:7033 stop:7326 length:294 start_codon:yes stop_codon:yes gene_type:complete